MCRLVARRGDDLDSAATKRDMRDAFGPLRQVERRAQILDLRRHDDDAGMPRKLLIGGAMIAMPMRMQDEQRNLAVALVGQQLHDCFRQRHLGRILGRTGIDQQRLVLADQQVQQRRFEVRAQALAQNDRLRLVVVDLNRRVGRLLAVFGSFVPVHFERSGDRVAPGTRREQQQSDSKLVLHFVFLSIVNQATAALNAARAAASSDTTRKLRTNDS